MQIWEKTKTLSPAPGEGLTREQFSVALRLIATAQVWALRNGRQMHAL